MYRICFYEKTNQKRNSIFQTIEERVYPESKWACTEQFLTPKTKDEKRSEMFTGLFAYIQGKNDGGM